MKKMKTIIGIFVLVLVLSPAYGVVPTFTDTFDGPTMTNWVEYIPGAYNGSGQYVLSDNDYIYRTLDTDGSGDGSFQMSMSVSDIDMGSSPIGGSTPGTWLNYLIYTGSVYDLHIMAENVATFPGTENTILNYGLWGAWDYQETVGTLTSLDLLVNYNESALTYTISRAINGGAMQQVAVHNSAGSGSDYKIEYIYSGTTNGFPGEPTHALDNYTIVPEPATLALLCLGGLVLRRRKH